MDSGEQLGFQHAAPSAPFDFLFLALGTLSGRMSRLAIFRGQTDESAGATCGWCQAKDFCSIPKPRNLKPKTRNKEAQSEGTSPREVGADSCSFSQGSLPGRRMPLDCAVFIRDL